MQMIGIPKRSETSDFRMRKYASAVRMRFSTACMQLNTRKCCVCVYACMYVYVQQLNKTKSFLIHDYVDYISRNVANERASERERGRGGGREKESRCFYNLTNSAGVKFNFSLVMNNIRILWIYIYRIYIVKVVCQDFARKNLSVHLTR